MILDGYAGAGGWDEGARQLGLTDIIGIDNWLDACRTGRAAGHPRICADVSTYPTRPFAGRTSGVIMSPPCQAWSMAGNRLGEQDQPRVHELVNTYAAGGDSVGDGWADARSHHAAQPVRWVRDLRPEWVALEQVPPVITLWQHIGDVLRGWGYSVWTGVLNAADYGVPQTRKRAILIASRVRPVGRPETTHEQNPPADALFGARQRWVSMADALGWDGADRPARTVCGDRSPRWTYGQGNSYATGWTLDRRTVSRGPRDTSVPVAPVPVDRPAPTLTGQGGHQWVFRSGQSVAGEGRAERRPDQPSVTITARADLCSWVADRPATTVAGDPRIAKPGHRDRAGGERQHTESIRVTAREAALLQGFRPDYPWRGNKTSVFQQIGNAVPPALGKAVLAVATGSTP